MSHRQNSNSQIPPLREYQKEDIEFLKQHPQMACFNEQRTGKTPTAVRTLIEQELTKILVICPTSAIYPWADEFKRWSSLPAIPIAGTPKHKADLVQSWTEGGLIVGYGSIKRTKRGTGLIDLIIEQQPQAVILDEAHRIKDRNTANAKMAFELSKHIPYRLALTGTPAPNKPHEIWSILHFLKPQTFRSFWTFVSEYCYTRKVTIHNKTFMDIGALKRTRVADLQYTLNQISTQRKRENVMKWLPKREPPIRVALPATKEQLKYLKELKDYFETETVITQGVLDRLIRYRQICLHPGLLGLKGKSPKIEWIHEYLSDYPDRPTIIFTKFTSFIHLLEKELTNIEYRTIVGATPVKQRATYIDDFQTGLCNLLILNIDVGKESLTLDRAEAIIFTDKYPPAGDIDQAQDRFIATTEDVAHIPKAIYELAIRDTYDEECYELVERRAASVDAINNFKKYMKGEQL